MTTLVDLTNPAHLALLATEARRLEAYWRGLSLRHDVSPCNRRTFAEDARNYAAMAGAAQALLDIPCDPSETDELDACLAAERGNIMGTVFYQLNAISLDSRRAA